MNFNLICISFFASCVLSVCAVPASDREIIARDLKVPVEDVTPTFEKELGTLKKDSHVPNDETVEVGDNKTTERFADEESNRSSTTEHTAIEAEDMEKSEIHPKDDQDSTVAPKEPTASPSVPANMLNQSIVDGTSMNESRTDALPPTVFPNDPKVVKSIKTYPSDFQEKLNHGNPEYSTDVTASSASEISEMITPLVEVIVQSTTQKSPGLVAETISQPIETREKMVSELSSSNGLGSKTEKTTIHGGFVAVIIAFAFAITSLISYLSLVAWKRYLEYRYGNRELLVNDFDANDINNFEL